MKKTILFALFLSTTLFFACSRSNIDLSIASHPNINPDHTGRPSPVRLKIFELRNNVAFESADFQTLFTNPVEALGADLLASDEFILTPGEVKHIKYIPNETTTYVGIIAGFRQLNRSVWRVGHLIIPKKSNSIGIELSDATILLILNKELDKWSAEEAVQSYNAGMQEHVPKKSQRSEAVTYPLETPQMTSTTNPIPEQTTQKSRVAVPEKIAPQETVPVNSLTDQEALKIQEQAQERAQKRAQEQAQERAQERAQAQVQETQQQAQKNTQEQVKRQVQEQFERQAQEQSIQNSQGQIQGKIINESPLEMTIVTDTAPR